MKIYQNKIKLLINIKECLLIIPNEDLNEGIWRGKQNTLI